MLLRIDAGSRGLAAQVDGVLGELRRRWQPPHALGANVEVDQAAAVAGSVGERAQDALHVELLVAPLVGMRIEEGGGVLLPRRAMPVERERERGPARLRPQLLLAHVMRPAAARLADAAAQHQQVDDAAVVHVGVVPVIHRRADDHHRLAAGLLGVVRELPRDRDHVLGLDAGDPGLPGRRVGHVVLVRTRHAVVAEASVEPVVGAQQIEHARHERLAVRERKTLHRHLVAPARRRPGPNGRSAASRCRRSTERPPAPRRRGVRAARAPVRSPLRSWRRAIRCSTCALRRRPNESRWSRSAPRRARCACRRRPSSTPNARLLQCAVEIRRAHVTPRHPAIALALEPHQHRQVGIAARVVGEVRHLTIEMELAQDHVPHRERQRGVGTLLRVQPQVGELGDLRVVRRDRHHLRALVADFGQEVRVGRARLRHVRAPGDDERRVVPVGRFGHVGLFAPGLRARRRQVAVPVVEAHAHAADQAQVAAARGVRHHRHGRDRREADDAVRAPALDRVRVGRRDQFLHLVPGRAHEPAHATHRLVGLHLHRIVDDRGPRADRIDGLRRASRQRRISRPRTIGYLMRLAL